MMRFHWLIILAILTSGCTRTLLNTTAIPTPPAQAEQPALYAPHVEQEYHIQVGDQLAVRSYYEPQLNQEVFVRPDGRISLLLMGDVAVAGKTPAELAGVVKKAYSRVVDSPDVTVVLKESADFTVYIGGEVRTPSVQPLRGALTVLQGITMVGGFLPTADRHQVLLLRHLEGGEYQTYKIDANKILSNQSQDIYLLRHDMIFVPRTGIADADLFIDQYINQIIPKSVLFNFGWIKNRNPQVEITP